jgi:hypothetical protein
MLMYAIVLLVWIAIPVYAIMKARSKSRDQMIVSAKKYRKLQQYADYLEYVLDYNLDVIVIPTEEN